MSNDALIKAVEIVGGQSAMARLCGVKQGHVWFWLNKRKGKLPAELALLIEHVTHGAVTRHDLRPDIFPPP